MSSIFKILLYLALVIVLVVLAHWNRDQYVDVTYLPARTLDDVPVFLVILGSIFSGVLLAGIIAVFENLRHRMRERELQRHIDELDSEVRELRNLPISGGLLDTGAEEPDWREPE